MMRDLAASRELAWRLFIRDVSAQYRQSILGYLWVFIPPLVASVPFVYLNVQGVIRIGETPIPYAAFAIISMIIWQVFANSLNAPLRSVSAARGILTRINLPREAILLSALAQVCFGFLVRLLLLVGVMAWFHLVPPATVLLFPVGILSLILFGFVIGILNYPTWFALWRRATDVTNLNDVPDVFEPGALSCPAIGYRRDELPTSIP